jgi:serine/threonine protein kinase
MIGTRLGKYRIIDQLGEGGMGTVWKAEDPALDRLVAIKAVKQSLAGEPEARERFLREAQAASALNHPGIATVHDLLDFEGQDYLVMEYIEGRTVRDMLESGRVSVRKAE